MTETTTTEDERPTARVVEQLARDDVERMRFIKMAGMRLGGAAAATPTAHSTSR
jgi:hypothetical protein